MYVEKQFLVQQKCLMIGEGVEGMRNKSLLFEVWDFLRIRRRWWLVPLIIMLFLVGALIVFGQSTAISAFIYALF